MSKALNLTGISRAVLKGSFLDFNMTAYSGKVSVISEAQVCLRQHLPRIQPWLVMAQRMRQMPAPLCLHTEHPLPKGPEVFNSELVQF